MSSKRLLDALTLVGSSRAIAARHVAIRTEQLNHYFRTSSLRNTISSGLGVSSTKQSRASTSARHPKQTSSSASNPEKDNDDRPRRIPSTDSIDPRINNTAVLDHQDGLHQDHFYDHSEDNSVLDGQSGVSLSVQQEKPNRYPLPDGSIPPENTVLGMQAPNTEILNARPVDEIAAEVVQRSHTVSHNTLHPEASNRSSIPNPSEPGQGSALEAQRIQRQSEFQIPSKPAEPPGSDAFGVDTEPAAKDSELGVDQEKDTYYRPSATSSPVLSALPRVKLPKKSGIIQAGDSHLPDGTNSDTFYNATGDGHGESTEQKIMQSLFQNPKTARLFKHGRNGPFNQMHRTGQAQMSQLASSNRAPTIEQSERAAKDAQKLGNDIAQEISTKEVSSSADLESDSAKSPYQMRQSRVPSSRLGRLWEYSGLAASMTMGAVGEGFRRATGSIDGSQASFLLSAGNLERLVSKLSKMRGAALKLGQMISFQDSKMLPAPLHEVLQRVQDSADYMPVSQRDQVLAADLGSEWRNLFEYFEDIPFAAASIGQVHGAVLKSDKRKVVVKVQYPGVAASIDSDLNNLTILLTASRLLPKGLYLDKTIANARTELAWECNYLREAECGRRFKSLLADESHTFAVPEMIDEASGKQVLTMERMEGIAVTRIPTLSQDEKDWIGQHILRLCLREIVEFKYMQTDPNWTNFLYNKSTQKLELLDFGATREYPDRFITLYAENLRAASRNDRKAVEKLSVELGYLTGYESPAMTEAHVDSVLTLAEPFAESAPQVYDFRDQTITDRVKSLIPVMLRERLAPPPEETYSLHRKLSGAFLLCARLGSRVRCREIFKTAMEKQAR